MARIKRYKKNNVNVFRQLFSVFQRIFQFDKRLLLVVLLNILTNAAAPFPTIVLPRYIIDVLVSVGY